MLCPALPVGGPGKGLLTMSGWVGVMGSPGGRGADFTVINMTLPNSLENCFFLVWGQSQFFGFLFHFLSALISRSRLLQGKGLRDTVLPFTVGYWVWLVKIIKFQWKLDWAPSENVPFSLDQISWYVVLLKSGIHKKCLKQNKMK